MDRKSFQALFTLTRLYQNSSAPITEDIYAHLIEKCHLTSDEISDIARPRTATRHAIRYVTKADRFALLHNVPFKDTYAVYKAERYAKTHMAICWGHEIPSTVALCDRLIFSDTVNEQIQFRRDDLIYARTETEQKLMRLLPPLSTALFGSSRQPSYLLDFRRRVTGRKVPQVSIFVARQEWNKVY